MVASTDLSDRLSSAEIDLLRSAVREGYFKAPRETTLVELASDHGISDREASALLRAGLDTITRAAVLEEESA